MSDISLEVEDLRLSLSEQTGFWRAIQLECDRGSPERAACGTIIDALQECSQRVSDALQAPKTDTDGATSSREKANT